MELRRKCATCHKELNELEGHPVTVEMPATRSFKLPSGGVDLLCDKCYEANHFGILQESECVMIESDRTISFFGGLLFQFESFEHVTSMVSNGSDETTVEFRVCFSYGMICKMVEPGLVEGFGVHSCVYAFLAGLIAQADCSSEVFVSDDFCAYCCLHNTPLDSKLFKCIAFGTCYANKKDKARSLQHQLSFGLVSEVSQASIFWRAQNVSREYHKISLHSKRLGITQSGSTIRSLTCFPFSATNIQSYVCS